MATASQIGKPHAAEAGRKPRATRVGRVTSDVRNKTIRVESKYLVRHPKYGKYARRSAVMHAHDENNEARRGDLVEIMECRPISKTKCWRLVRVLQKAPQDAAEIAP